MTVLLRISFFCLMFFLPSGGGINFGGLMSLDKLTSALFMLSFGGMLAIKRIRFQGGNRTFKWMLFLLFCMMMSLLWAFDFDEELRRTLTFSQIVLLIWAVGVTAKKFGLPIIISGVRAYVLGSAFMLAFSFLSGAGQASMDTVSQQRMASLLGVIVDPNYYASLLGVGVVASIYLMMRKTSSFKRMIWGSCGILFILGILFSGSRGGLLSLFLSLAFTGAASLFSNNRKLAGAILVGGALLSWGIVFVFMSGILSEGISKRLTDVEYAEHSLAYRMSLNSAAVDYVLTENMLGTSFSGWFERSKQIHYIHNDLFFVLGVYGFLGLLGWLGCVLSSSFYLWRLKPSDEWLMCLSIFLFLFFSGMSVTQIFMKHYWIFMILISSMTPAWCHKYFERRRSANFSH